MKKTWFAVFVLSLVMAGGVFAQEYTVYLGGTVHGFITVQKDRSGKITITPSISSDGGVWVGRALCPILPEEGFDIRRTTKNIVIDGNTTTETLTDGKWYKTVIAGNTTTYTTSDGYWTETANDGKTIMVTTSRGNSTNTVIEGNTLTKTYPNATWSITHYDDRGAATTTTHSRDPWQRVVVTENTMTETDSLGSWSRAVINGNTTTVTKDGSLSYEEVIRGNTRTLTYSYGSGYRVVVEGNMITRTSLDGKTKVVVDKQGTDIFVTLTGTAYYSDDIGVSERDRIKSTIDAIRSGRVKDGKFYELIDYGR